MITNMIPKVGARFSISDIEFEVAAIEKTQIRYSTVAGGKVQHFSIIKYQNLLNNGQLTLLNNKDDGEISLEHLSEFEIESMNRRLSYVREIYNKAIHPTVKKEIAPIVHKVSIKINDKKPPSRSSIARWYKAYITSNRNPRSLVPRTKYKGNRNFRFDPNVERIISTRIEKDYLTQQRITAVAIRSNIITDIDKEYDGNTSHLEIPSERAINRRIAQIDPYKRSKARDGHIIANRSFKAAGRRIRANRVMETVEADGNILDVLIVDEETGEVMGRPYGTCLIDKYSRCIIAFVVTMIPFSSATLLKTLKIGVSGNNEKFGGLFETLVVDNGSDYISSSVRNFCNDMGIRIEHGAPRDPNSKPHVERFFGTLNTQLIHTLPGSTFSNPTHKGDYKSKKLACLTLDNLNNFIDQWLETIYHKTIHRGHGRAPEMLWKEGIKNNPIITYPIEYLDKIAREISTRHISKGRVTIDNLQWFSHALSTIEQDCKNKGIKPKVDVYIDSLNLEKVFIKDPRDDSVFIQADAVFSNYCEGLTLYEHKIIWNELKDKGKEDLASYGEYYLEIAHAKLFEDISDHNNKYAKKRIARIKENYKQLENIKNKEKTKLNKNKHAPIDPPISEDFGEIETTHIHNQKTIENKSFGFRSL